jgi:hypothetical protein
MTTHQPPIAITDSTPVAVSVPVVPRPRPLTDLTDAMFAIRDRVTSLRVELVKIIGYGVLNDWDERPASIRDRAPRLTEIARALTKDNDAVIAILETRARREQVEALAVRFASGFARQPGDLSAYAAAIFDVIEDNDLDLNTDPMRFASGASDRPVSIPIEAVALGAMMLRREIKFAPSAAEFRDACVKARSSIFNLYRDIGSELRRVTNALKPQLPSSSSPRARMTAELRDLHRPYGHPLRMEGQED